MKHWILTALQEVQHAYPHAELVSATGKYHLACPDLYLPTPAIPRLEVLIKNSDTTALPAHHFLKLAKKCLLNTVDYTIFC